MPDAVHPLAPHHLPGFLPGPDGSDVLFNVVVVVMIVLVAIAGNLYLRLHAMPERMAHRSNSVQLQAVAVLTLLALFTHNQILWVLALLLAVLRFPDVETPLNRIADIVERRLGGGPTPPAPSAASEKRDA